MKKLNLNKIEVAIGKLIGEEMFKKSPFQIIK
jgi:hypothetical protein